MADKAKCSKTSIQIHTDLVLLPWNRSIYKHDRPHHHHHNLHLNCLGHLKIKLVISWIKNIYIPLITTEHFLCVI